MAAKAPAYLAYFFMPIDWMGLSDLILRKSPQLKARIGALTSQKLHLPIMLRLQ